MSFGPRDAEELTGIPSRRIQFYVENGLISVNDPTPGRGLARNFSLKSIFELFIIKELAANGVELRSIKRIFREGRQVAPDLFEIENYVKEKPPGFFILIYGGGEKITFRTERDPKRNRKRTNQIALDLEKWSSALVINLSRVWDQMNKP